MKNQMLISELALEYGISRPTLIYYDKIGILIPFHDKKTGYRYYSLQDMEKLEMILALKKAGLSLKGIKQFLSNPSNQTNIHLLQLKKIKVQEKIAELSNLETLLNKRILHFKEYKNLEIYDGIQLQSYEKIPIHTMPINHNHSSPLEFATRNLKKQLDNTAHGYGSVMSKYGFILNKDSFLAQNYSNYSYIFDAFSIGEKEPSSTPAANYVCMLHLGSLEHIDKTYKQMLQYISTQKLSIQGNIYLFPLIDLWSASTVKENITEIRIPVKK